MKEARQWKKYFCWVILLGLCICSAWADVPRLIDYQGRLMDTAGKPVPDSNYLVIINLYDSTQSTVLWTKTYTSVVTKNGYFSLVLGDTTPQWTGLDFNQQYYLGTQIGTDNEMTPRQPWNAAPYAMTVADNAVTTNKIKDGAVTSGKIADGTISTCDIADNTVTAAKIASGTITGAKIAGTTITGSNIASGTITADKMDMNAILPVGSIIAWHKTLYNSLDTTHWVECNGGTVRTDVGSPIGGASIPNLNGDGRFLRGSSTSGTLQADAFQGHMHAPLNGSGFIGTGGSNNWLGSGSSLSVNSTTDNPVTDGVNGTPRTANETRPINMSVVWIMKIK